MELDPRSMAYRKMSLRKLSRAQVLTKQKLIRKDEGTKVRRMTVALLTVSFSRFRACLAGKGQGIRPIIFG